MKFDSASNNINFKMLSENGGYFCLGLNVLTSKSAKFATTYAMMIQSKTEKYHSTIGILTESSLMDASLGFIKIK